MLQLTAVIMHVRMFLCQEVYEHIVGSMVRLKIKEVAESKGISMSRLSRLADVSYNTMLILYHKPDHDVSITILDRIAQALNVSICDLIEQSPK